MSALVSVSVPCNIPIETSSSRCHLEIKARGVVSVILVCGLKHQNMTQACLCSFSGGGFSLRQFLFLICQTLDLCCCILMEAKVFLGFPWGSPMEHTPGVRCSVVLCGVWDDFLPTVSPLLLVKWSHYIQTTANLGHGTCVAVVIYLLLILYPLWIKLYI